MTEKQSSLLQKYLSDEYIDLLVEKEKYSEFIGMILILKQPNRWSKWILPRIEERSENQTWYEVLIDLEIFDIFSFISFIAE